MAVPLDWSVRISEMEVCLIGPAAHAAKPFNIWQQTSCLITLLVCWTDAGSARRQAERAETTDRGEGSSGSECRNRAAAAGATAECDDRKWHARALLLVQR